MLGLLIVIGISITIVTSDMMHNFILYLHNIGVVGSIYWYIFILLLPLILLLLKPLMNSVRKKSILVRIITAFMVFLLFLIIILIVVGNFYFDLSQLYK